MIMSIEFSQISYLLDNIKYKIKRKKNQNTKIYKIIKLQKSLN